MIDRETLLTLIPAYALGVLEVDEDRQVEALLAEDEYARQLLQEYRRMVEAIALTAPAQSPPPGLERKLLQRARRKPRRRATLFMGAAAAALFVFAVVGILLKLFADQPNIAQVYERLAADPRATRIALIADADAAIQGQLVYSPDENTAIIQVVDLPTLEAGQAYQLWLVDEAGFTSGGVFRGGEGITYIQVPIMRPIAAYIRFGVSIEPESGSPFGDRPSGERVFNIPIQRG